MNLCTSLRLLVPAALTFFCLQANAQVDIGVKAGLSIPSLKSGGNETDINAGYKSRLGPDFGVLVEYHVNKRFSIQGMINYSAQGGKRTGFQPFAFPDQLVGLLPPGAPKPPYLYADFKSVAKLNYLMVPVLAKFGWDLGAHSPWRLHVAAGPFAGFLLSAKQETSGTTAIYADPGAKVMLTPATFSMNNTTDIKNQLNTFNVGVIGNVGITYTLSAYHRVFAEVGGNYGFLNIQKGTENGKNNIGAATVSLGYAYRLHKTK
ncbi:porin family protein [Chitinophaga nivalis]|uniref:PorT family protein n=1 Tax=Chitinophaga nivalis TaxID=2991709 RepID=A0ABT3IHG0_9BACT|nr:porin family protein [Chitinophaga nivalis]MCW3466922.1 PorT family protein [Chitinophaga nivalis]MCW3483387.1 PorT family protein [Chitinophaga nivalis]